MSATSKIVTCSVIGGLLLCGVGGYLLFNKLFDPPMAAADQFMTTLESGNTRAAYDMLCGETQQHYDAAEFETYVGKNPPIAHDVAWGGEINGFGGGATALIGGSITTRKGTTSHEYALLEEDGVWKMCGDPY